ncbi:DUF4369 domain-containing protein [Gangjinia marincola]|uniref:DUF4369 domain-containing protein n=2 Tax=Gangjinia marincola TaxID=578463 RepID=A0ABP3XWI0_9FLAO
MIVTGSVKGLKKGTLYLQRIQDSILVNADSIVVKGQPTFKLSTTVTEPEVFYLYLDKVDQSDYDDRIEFFGEKGTISIKSNLDHFQRDAEVKGSKNQKLLKEYRTNAQKLNDQNLDLIKENFEAQKEGNEEKIFALNAQYDNYLKRKYLYTINYAVNNADHEVAPYLALNEIFDANLRFLDTIYTKLTPKVKESLYGKQLEKFIEDRRDLELLKPQDSIQ